MDNGPENPETRIDRVPAGSILDRWSESAWEDGLQVDQMRDMQSVKVHTVNSVYELRIISASECQVLLRGGKYYPELTPVRFSGSTFGGSFIKMRGIYVGFCMEFSLGGLRIFTTSPVQWIGPVEDPGEIPLPAISPPDNAQSAP
jgi:hypothetical protein